MIKTRRKKLISIIMPVYNAGGYLKDAISDVLHQTYENFELICVNDGSTDTSASVLDGYAKWDNRIRVMHKKNGGGASARNVGIDMATGEYIIFLDADDRFSPKLLEDTVTQAVETNADIVAFGAEAFDLNTGIILEGGFEKSVLDMEKVPDKEVFSYEDCPNDIFQFCAPLTSNKLYGVDLIKRTGIRYQEIPYNDDSYFACINTVLADRIAVVDEKLFTYRDGNPMSNSKYRMRRDIPQYNFEMFLAIRNKLIELGRYGEVAQSLAKMAAGQVLYHLNAITDDNIDIYRRYYDAGYIPTMRIDKLEESDFDDEVQYEEIRKLVEKGFEKYILHRYALLVDFEDWHYADERYRQSLENRPEDRHFFDIGRIPEGSRVVLYGAGKRGRYIYEMNKKTNKYNLVAWVDKNADKIGAIDGITIRKPKDIPSIEFDYITVGTSSTNIKLAEEIRKELLEYTDNEKIIW